MFDIHHAKITVQGSLLQGLVLGMCFYVCVCGGGDGWVGGGGMFQVYLKQGLV